MRKGFSKIHVTKRSNKINLVWPETAKNNHLLEVIEFLVPGSREFGKVGGFVIIILPPLIHVLLEVLPINQGGVF